MIVDGLTNLRDGAAIKPVPVSIDADGVVHDASPETAADASKPAATTGNN